MVFEFDHAALKNIIAAFEDRSKIEIGIPEGDSTLSTIAAAHEFGANIPVTDKMKGYFKGHFGFWLSKTAINIPARSFIRKTVSQKAETFLGDINAGQDFILLNMAEGAWLGQLEDFGRKWVGYIRQCFETSGFGQWQPLSALTISDGGSTPLIRTGKLMNAITSKVTSGQ